MELTLVCFWLRVDAIWKQNYSIAYMYFDFNSVSALSEKIHLKPWYCCIYFNTVIFWDAFNWESLQSYHWESFDLSLHYTVMGPSSGRRGHIWLFVLTLLRVIGNLQNCYLLVLSDAALISLQKLKGFLWFFL